MAHRISDNAIASALVEESDDELDELFLPGSEDESDHLSVQSECESEVEEEEITSGAAQKEATKKTPEDIPDKGVHGSATTLKPKGISRHARSMKTTSSSARRRELEVREKLARMELKQAQAATKLARVILELAQCEEEDSVDEDQEDRTAQAQNWIETSVLEENNMRKHAQ
ncbi:unnamed protein product [Parnassius apollo]|uniref:(apollo) hypothetical protein n=1 Tax=Parnassius apollo TaxID=110799 RepID=A0A8S3YG15_PARAO|nr:unnamed protein product [Parnassius apollo]